jgi:hypothetical protein
MHVRRRPARAKELQKTDASGKKNTELQGAMSAPMLLSRQDAATALGRVSVRTVDRLRADGSLESARVRGRAMISAGSLERFLGLAGDDAAAIRRRDWDGFEIPVLDGLRAEKRKSRNERRAA